MKIYAFKNKDGNFAWQSIVFNKKNEYINCPIFFAPLTAAFDDPQSLKYSSFANLVLCPEKWIDSWRESRVDPDSKEGNPLVDTTPILMFDTLKVDSK